MGSYHKTSTVFQMEAAECGAASLAMILGYFGKHLPLEQLRTETGVSRDGCNAGNIMRAAKGHGLDCKGFRLEPEALREVRTPCIIHWNFNHFVVFEGFKGRYAWLNDPAVGRRKLTLQELDEGFTGVVLTFSPTDRFVREKGKNGPGAFLAERLRGRSGPLLQLLYLGLLTVIPGAAMPILCQIFVDDVLLGGCRNFLPGILALTGGLALLSAYLIRCRDRMAQKLCSKMTLLSEMEFLRHMLRLPLNFFEQRNTGELVKRMQSDQRISGFLAEDLPKIIVSCAAAGLYLLLLLLYSPLMTLVGAVCTAVCVRAGLRRHARDTAVRQRISGGRLYSVLCAGLSISDTLKASGAEDGYLGRALGFQAQNMELHLRQARLKRVTDAVSAEMAAVSGVLFLLVGGDLVLRGRLSAGMLIAFFGLFDSFMRQADALAGGFRRLRTLSSDIGCVDDVEKYPEDSCYEGKAGENDQKLSGEVELREVSFGYSPLKPALVEQFSFRLNCGETAALVGPSGCGKSTVSRLVSGLYRPWSGEILLDGRPLGEISRGCINASIATVSQNITLFSGTIRDNLTMWNGAVPEEDMIAAAKDACIHDFITQCPGGYDFLLAENGANLSGGQCQRLEIARALATKPSILVLDEATSALDPLVEKKIMDNIRRRGCTCIIVAHRLSTIRDCHQILVMKGGRIIQRGTHSDLMQQDGCYRELIQNL